MFIYETHQHTSGCSKCGKVTSREAVHSIKESGFSGVVITNHFYHGNTAIDRNLPWKDFCKAYSDDYYEAKDEGCKLGVDVLFGLEVGISDGKEVLLYGISPDLIGNYPELREGGLKPLSEVVRAAGGVVIQAHPCRKAAYIKDDGLLLDRNYLDGYEIYNYGNSEEANRQAVNQVENSGLILTAGTDCHIYQTEHRFGISCSHRITSESELAQVLKSRDFKLYLG